MTTLHRSNHFHSYVAQQIFSGLGGVMIVRGALDEIPEIQAAQEELIFLKDFDLSKPMNSPDPYFGIQMPVREGPLVTVNGQVNPAFAPQNRMIPFFKYVSRCGSRHKIQRLETKLF